MQIELSDPLSNLGEKLLRLLRLALRLLHVLGLLESLGFVAPQSPPAYSGGDWGTVSSALDHAPFLAVRISPLTPAMHGSHGRSSPHAPHRSGFARIAAIRSRADAISPSDRNVVSICRLA